MVSEVLSRGKENATTTKDLMRICGFEHKRDLTLQIAKEREAGELICSTTAGQGGYYLPQNREEIKVFIRSMNNRAINTFRAIKSAKKFLEQIEGQVYLDEQQIDD